MTKYSRKGLQIKNIKIIGAYGFKRNEYSCSAFSCVCVNISEARQTDWNDPKIYKVSH